MAFLKWLASTILGALFGAGVEAIDRKRGDDAQREAGRLEQKAVDQQAALDGQKRMDAASAAREPLEDALDQGKL